MRTVFCALLAVVAVSTPALGDIVSTDRLRFFADFRVRLESDFDSHRADLSERDDRTRVRVRARVGLEFTASDAVTLGVRLRSGSELSHQSPHVTLIDFDNNDTGDADFDADKWFVRAETGRVWGWAGRNGFPFWKQNELLWDDDVTVMGLAGGYRGDVGASGSLAFNAAYLTPPVGMQAFAGELAGTQLVYDRDADAVGFTLAAGVLAYSAADPADDADALLLRNGNGLSDYLIWTASGQLRLDAGGRPLKLGLDLLHNGEDYVVNADQTDGAVVSVFYGRVKERGDWQAGYTWARIETLAVIASYAQDDWVRWGSATETDSSDLEGHELRFVYGTSARSNLVARLYLVEAITSAQDGKRFRIDFNYRF